MIADNLDRAARASVENVRRDLARGEYIVLAQSWES